MIATRKSNQGLVERSLHRPYSLLPSGRYSTSLTPYGASFWALILAACGGGGGGPALTTEGAPPGKEGDDTGGPTTSGGTQGFARASGSVFDPPVQNAPVYVDANGDGELNPDDGDGIWEEGEDYLIGRTDAQGRYSGSVPDSLKNNIRIAHTSAAGVVHKNPDGTDAGTLPEVLKAPANAKVISAFSHSVVQGYATEAALKERSPNGYDPLNHNAWLEDGRPTNITPADIAKIKQIAKSLTSTIRNIETKLGGLQEIVAEMRKQIAILMKRSFSTAEEAPEDPEQGPQEEVLDPTESTPPPKASPVVPANARPTSVSLSQRTRQVEEGGDLPGGALARITIQDDGLGTVGLTLSGADSGLFRYEPVAGPGQHGKYDLYLASGVTLDQLSVGTHSVTIQATGNGTGDNPAPVTFTLTVRNDPDNDVAVPEFASTGTVSRSIPEGSTTTGYTAQATATAGTVSYAITGGTDGRKFDIDARTGVVTFTAKSDHDTARDADRDNIYEIEITATATSTDETATRSAIQRVTITLTNVNEATTGVIAITADGTELSGAVNTNTVLTVHETTPIADEDGIKSKTFIWRDGAGTQVGEGSSFTPTSAGTYRAVAIVVDNDDNQQEIDSQNMEVTAPPLQAPPNIAPTISSIRIVPSSESPLTGQQLTAHTEVSSENSIAAQWITWYSVRENPLGVSFLTGTKIIPNAPGVWRAILHIRDNDGNVERFFSEPITVADSSPTITIRLPAQQTQITETVGNEVTQHIDTGIAVIVRDVDNNLSSLVIKSWQKGRWQVDDRFDVQKDKLIIKKGKQFDYESQDNPNGEITLWIIARDEIHNSVSRTTTIQLTNADEPTIVNGLSITGLTNGSVQTGTSLTAVVEAHDPDVNALNYSYVWYYLYAQPDQADSGPLSRSKSFTPSKPGTYVLIVLIRDNNSNDYKSAQQQFTVTEPALSNPTPPPTTPPTTPETEHPSQNARFYSTEIGVFKDNGYVFSLPETDEDYHIIGTVRYGDHLDPDESAGRTLYTLGGKHRHLLRLGNDGVLKLGRGVDLDAEGVNGLAELEFTVSALFWPHDRENGTLEFARTAVSRVVIFDPLNPHSEPDSVTPAPPYIGIDGDQTMIRETVGDERTVSSRPTGISVITGDPNDDLDQIRIESQQDGRWQADDRFEVRNDTLFVKAGKQFDYEDLDNPNGEIALRITATDAAGNSVYRNLTIQLTNADEPIIVNSLSITGLSNGSVQTGTSLTAEIDAHDSDVSTLEYTYLWLHETRTEPVSRSQSFTPSTPGTYVLTVLIHDNNFNTHEWVRQEFTVTGSGTSNPTPSSSAPVTEYPGQNIRFFSTETGIFEDNAYVFSLPETVDDYHIIGKVRYGDHLNPNLSPGYTLYTLGGKHSHLLRLSSEGILFLGRDVDLDAEGVNGLAELQFTISALYFPNVRGAGNTTFSKTAVSKIVIFDPLDPEDVRQHAAPSKPPHITINDEHQAIMETVGDERTERSLNTGIRVLVIDPNHDLDQIRVESQRDGEWEVDERFALQNNQLIIRPDKQLDYEDPNNPNGVITLRITATDDAGHSVRRILTLQLTNADDPATGSVTVTGPASPRTGQALTATSRASDDDGIASQLVTWTRDGVPVTGDDGRPVTGNSVTPGVGEAGEWRAILTVTDSLGNTRSFTSDPVTVTTPAPPPPTPATRNLAREIHENHPLTKPIIDLDGTGVFTMAPAAGAPDNQFFRVDAATGKIWFVPYDPDGDGEQDPGDYHLLDAEDDRDVGGDGTYDLRLTRTAPDGTVETIDLALTVQDLPVVNAHGETVERTEATRGDSIGMVYHYLRMDSEVLKERIAGLIDDWFRDYRSGLTPQETATQTQYLKYLLDGEAWWTPPDGSTLHMSWSLNTKRLNSQQTIDAARAKVERALAEYETFLTIDFIEVAHNAHSLGALEFSINKNSGSSGGFASLVRWGGGVSTGLGIHISTYIHEIGHVLGLAHPFGYTDSSTHTGPPKQGHFGKTPDEENTSNSIMTYGPVEKSTITQNDINALQFLYGIPGTDYHGLYAEIEDWFDQPGHDVPIL